MKTTSININNVASCDRYEPEYWIVTNQLDKLFKQCKHKPLIEYSVSIKKGIFDLKAEKYQQSGVPFLRISNLKYFELDKTGMVYISEKDNSLNTKTILSYGDIAFSKIGTLGKILRINKEYPYVNISQNLIGVKLKDNVDKGYIFAFLLSKLTLAQINKNRKKQLQDKLNLDDVKYIQIIDIEDKLKSNIGNKVLDIENYIYTANSLVNKAKQFFYSCLNIDFKTIIKENAYSVKKSNFVNADLWTPMYSYPLFVNTLKTIREKWPTVNIGTITDVVKGNEVGSDNYIGYIDKHKTDVPFIRTSDIVNNEIDQYPDYFVSENIYDALNQKFNDGDVLFTKDGKIGMVGILTEYDKAIISSGIVGLRLNKKAKEYNITPEYVFIALSIKEIGIYASKRRTVVASTIPHLREERMKEIEIPILDKVSIDKITDWVKQAIKLKTEKKRLIDEVRGDMDSYFELL